MILSVFAGTAFVGGAAAADSTDASNATEELQSSANVQEDSFKPMTLSWFRDDGTANGPYPIPPQEYVGDEPQYPAMLFNNAKADDQFAVDNSTARNPNGKWDMLVLNVEVGESTLNELNPPGADTPEETGLVTQNFIDNEDWGLDITQDNGDKTLDVAANQEGYEEPEVASETDESIPPVMVIADTLSVNTDYMMDGDPETSLYVWIDPNRATLDENGEEAGFETGESYTADINIHDQTETTSFEMVEGDTIFNQQDAPNNAQAEITGMSNLAYGTAVEMVVETESGETMSHETTVGSSLNDGNQYLADAENPGSIPRAPVTGTFDLTGLEGEEIDVTVYGESDRGTGDFVNESGSTTLPVGDIIDEDYTIDNTTIRDSKPLTIAYTNPDYMTPTGIANQVGDGHLSGDSSIAKNTNVEQPYFDEMFLHYETGTEVFDAIQKSPGTDAIDQFQNSPLSLDVTQTNADGAPKELDLSQNDSGVYIVPDNDSSDARLYNSSQQTGMFFSFKLNDMVFFQDGEKTEPDVGDEFEATLSIETEEQGTIEETINFEIVEGKTVLATDSLELTQSGSAEVTFNSTMARGTTMDIQLASEDGTINTSTGEMTLGGMGPNICCDGPSTAPWGSISATFDTNEIPQGTDITATARIVADLPDNYETPLTVAEASGQIVEPPSGNVSASAQSGDGSSVTIDSVGMSDGGFIAVRSSSGATLGSSSYLEAGTHSDVTVELDDGVSEDSTLTVVVHTDSDGDETYDYPVDDDPYPTEDGGELSTTLEYTVEGQPGGTPTPTPGTSTSTSDDGGDETTTDVDGSSGVPGFGVSAALVALLAAGFLLYRRD